ncbi:methyl-accepting chemotaxis protein [Duganella callida]|uniref:HAMP domain-containing protein n=1 Tax=Duganella callida TaxID=2561932 RepID=A0A4Y9SFG4_9BURK|nr:methyl-accepting chemotaxis protein [Duganella callida]TFW21693.1 HAMP domain-containing protein [Duganella callida]
MKNLNIGTRLAAGFGLVLALMILMTAIGIRHMHTVAMATSDMMQQPLAKERMIADWYRLIHTSVRRTSAISKSADPSLGPFFADDVKQSTAEINSLQKKVEELLEGDEEKAMFAEMMKNRKLYVASRDKIVALKKEGKVDEAAEELEQRFTPYGKAYLGSLGGLLDHQRKSIDAQAQKVETLYEGNRAFMIGFGLVVLALGAFCAWRLTRGITVPLCQAVGIAEAVAHRDLTTHIEATTTDETGRLLQALQKMNDGLIGIVTEVRQRTESISTASSEIAAGNLDLSGRTEEQASSLEETASSMEELTATVKQNADNARQANQLAVKASEVAQRGGGVVSEVVHTMEAIHGSSRKIADIISVIDGIAFQTNILALNAAVEAARAGEQGRGFAVVASEVRNLAQRSAAAAKEIKALIDDSLDKVDAGSMLVTQAGSTMGEVVESIQRVTDIMGEITSATLEQSSGIEQVNMAIGQMDQVTQQNAALVEEAAAAASSLHDQADALSAVVAVFKLDDQPASRRLQLR